MEKHVYAGCQFPSNRAEIPQIIEEIERQKAQRYDVVINSKRLEFKIVDKQLLLGINASGRRELVPVTKQVHRQMAQYMGIRMTDRFYKWLSVGTQNPGSNRVEKLVDPAGNWETWCDLMNDFMHTEAENKLVRCVKNKDGQLYARALLSDRYEVIPNADFFYAIFDAMRAAKAEIWHARLSEDRFFLYAVAPGIAAQVNTERAFDPGDGWQSRWYGKEGDVVNAALCASNSETGEGGVGVSQAILRRVCINYCVWQDVIAKAHIGKRHEADRFLSDDTIKQRNAFFFGQIKDVVAGTFSPEEFQRIVDAMNGATKDTVEDAEEAADALQLVYDVSEERKNKIRNMFLREHDYSRFGLANAVTGCAHEIEADPQTAFQMEQLGTALLQTNMTKLLKAAEAKKKETEKEEAPVQAVA